MKKLLTLAAVLWSLGAQAQDIPAHSIPIGGGPGVVGWASAGPCAANQTIVWSGVASDPACVTITTSSLALNHIFVGNASNIPTDVAMSGDATIVSSGALTLATVNSNTGSWGSSTLIPIITVNAKGLITAVSTATINVTATTCTNQFVSAIGATGAATCTTPTLASAQFANQGTTTTLLHGNAAGNPSFGQVTVSDLANMLANTVLSNWTSGSAAPVANTWPACSNDGLHGLTYTNGTGLVCTAITAGTIGGSTGGTDKAALRANGAGGATVQSSAMLIADTTGALSRAGNGGIPLQGTNTNDSAATGFVGEIIESTVLSGASIGLTTNTSTNITTISLTAGDWDVWGTGAITTSVGATNVIVAISQVSATLPTIPNGGAFSTINANSVDTVSPTGQMRISLTGTSTIYLVMRVSFASGSANGYGYLAGRRRR